MLDQNTDRMWYVIGAVLIGAAIIFGMNTLMPEAFASVGGMFEDIIGITDNQIEDISKGVRINTVSHFINDSTATINGTIGVEGSVVEKNIPIVPGETYVVRYRLHGDSGIMHVFSHEFETSNNIHNSIYSEIFPPNAWSGYPRFASRYASIDRYGDVIEIEFVADEKDNFLTLTNSNEYGVKLEGYQKFTVKYTNIQVYRK